MSSPASRRSQRNSQSATPRSTRSSRVPAASSPLAANGPGSTIKENQASATPSSRLRFRSNAPATSSPMFFRSSPMTGQEVVDSDGDATPRPAGNLGESSPIHYAASSSPTRSRQQTRPSNLGSESSDLFVRTPRSNTHIAARDRRGDVLSDFPRSEEDAARRTFDGRGRPTRDGTFATLDPTTSEANVLSGASDRVLWGSNIPQAEVHRTIIDFLWNFEKRYRMIKDDEISEDDFLDADHPARQKEYIDMMSAMLELGTTSLNVDLKNIKSYPPTIKLWHQFQDFPSEVVHLFDNAIKEIMIELAEKKMSSRRSDNGPVNASAPRARDSSSLPPVPSSDADMNDHTAPASTQEETHDLVREVELKVYRVRPFNLDSSVNLRELDPADIDRVISVKGLVIRTTPIIPDMRDAFFQCSVCNHTTIAEINRGKIAEPTQCPREACSSANSMQIIHNRSGFADKQVIKLQETPDSVPDGQTPHSVSICAYDELVDFCKAGDRVEITGIFKCSPVRVNPRQRSLKNVYKTFVDALHIQKVDRRRMGVDASTIEQDVSQQVANGTEEVRKVTDEEEAKIRETGARPDVYELLSRSLAPSIYELDDVKKGILLQLFGGTNKSFQKGGNPKYRGDINVLLCGDPSTSKSQLLQYVHKIAPRGVYTSGKGSSAVGLTAYVTRDPETRQLVLESGALVLSDGGVCCIDEFDKMSDATRSVLHEVMEQQTVSIAKAGIITTLNARTSILASANPIGSKYNPNLPVPQNIDLPPTLLSRFDLVYLILDRVDEQADRRLAKHLVSMYLEDRPDNANAREVVPVEFLTSYISYARSNIHPKITQAASEELVKAYVEMRKLGEDVRAAERRITATTRQLESMIRLAEAHAKMRLSEEVTADDVVEAVRLIKSALKQAATDARTGLIDMGLLTEGTSASERRRKQDLKTAITSLLDEMTRDGGAVRYSDLAKRLMEQSSVTVEGEELTEALKSLQQEGQLQMSGEGARRSLRRVTGL